MSFLTVDKFGQLDAEDLGLKLRSFSGYEEISRLFVFHLEMDLLDEKSDSVTADKLMGKQIIFSVQQPQRYFSGIISRLSLGQVDRQGRRECRVEVVPELWTLTEILDSRKFKSQTVLDLVRSTLDETRLDVELVDRTKTRADLHPARVNPTQFDETTMNFLGRLMDEEGIFYFFRNEIEEGKGRSQVVMGDESRDYDDAQLKLAYQPTGNVVDTNSVTVWERQFQYRPSHWNIQDYDHRKARDLGMTLAGGTGPLHKFKRKARFYDKDYGRNRLDNFMERESVSREYVEAESQCQLLYPGLKFKLEDHPSSSENGSYVVSAVEHYAVELDSPGNSSHEYENRFVCVPAERRVVANPASSSQRSGAVSFTPRQQRTSTIGAAANPAGNSSGQHANNEPRVGTATIADLAIVVNRDGNIETVGQTDIETDNGVDYVYIKYQWQVNTDWSYDNWKAKDHRVRVAQLMAGDNWGAKFMPRVGDEVIVLFADGDPDSQHNVIIGVLNNSLNKFLDKSAKRDTMQTVKIIEDNPFSDNGDRVIEPAFSPPRHRVGATNETEQREVPDLSIPEVSGIRTRTSKSNPSAATDHNSLLFDDRDNQEQVYLHAAKDLNIQVENDLYIEVKGDKRELIRGNYYQVICVGGIPEGSDGYNNRDDYQQRNYDGAGDAAANTGVFLGVADGVSFDYDKTYEVKTVEWKPGYLRWEERTESDYNIELRPTGDIKETHLGDNDEFHSGRSAEVHMGTSTVEHTGLAVETHIGDSRTDHIGNSTDYRRGASHSWNDGLCLSFAFPFSLSVTTGVDINVMAGLELNFNALTLNAYAAAMEVGGFKYEKVHKGVFDHETELNKVKILLQQIDGIKFGKSGLTIKNSNLTINNATTATFNN